MQTLRELLAYPGIERLANRMLLAEICGFSLAQLIARDDYQLTTEQYSRYQSWLQRVAAGEPVNYVLGYREFYSRRFKVTSDTLIPRPETEILVAEALKRAPQNGSVVDLGTGSGCVAVTLKLERPDLFLTALDNSLAAVAVAAENAARLAAKVEFLSSDWYAGLNESRFDLVVSNPPYIEAGDPHLSSLRYEPTTALTDFSDGLSCLRQIVSGSLSHLKPEGWLMVEHGFDQALRVRALFVNAGLQDVVTVVDYAGIERVTIGRKR